MKTSTPCAWKDGFQDGVAGIASTAVVVSGLMAARPAAPRAVTGIRQRKSQGEGDIHRVLILGVGLSGHASFNCNCGVHAHVGTAQRQRNPPGILRERQYRLVVGNAVGS